MCQRRIYELGSKERWKSVTEYVTRNHLKNEHSCSPYISFESVDIRCNYSKIGSIVLGLVDTEYPLTCTHHLSKVLKSLAEEKLVMAFHNSII
jgi:hypothetical protein